MKTSDEIKKSVKEKYGEIAEGKVSIESITSPSSCCCGGEKNRAVLDMSIAYSRRDQAAIPEGADLGLGCGTPASFADLSEGMTVLDLGSGAGVDCFVAAQYIGSSGKVIGVDMTEEMVKRANENKQKVGARNVEFRLGEIESLPVDSNSVDRVISNCVINLVPRKENAFREIYRVLKPNGKFSVSDIVVDGVISDKEREDASLWAGCISGAISRKEYLQIIADAGFSDVRVISEKQYDYKLSSGGGLFSITLSGSKK